MANPLARRIMGNIAGKNGKGNSNVHASSSVKNISEEEERLLINIINKEPRYKSRGSNNVNHVDSAPRSNYRKSIKLEDLVKNNKGTDTERSNKPTTEKGSVTLNQLASKNKKLDNTEGESMNKVEGDQNKKDKNVNKVVNNNLEAGIPKVSLDAIGTKGSLK